MVYCCYIRVRNKTLSLIGRYKDLIRHFHEIIGIIMTSDQLLANTYLSHYHIIIVCVYLLHLWFVLITIATSPVLGVCNNDGTVDAGEQCDDGNLVSNDGCTNCTLDISLDLNSTNPSSTNSSREFFELDQVEYFTEPGEFSLYVNPLKVRKII